MAGSLIQSVTTLDLVMISSVLLWSAGTMLNFEPLRQTVSQSNARLAVRCPKMSPIQLQRRGEPQN